MARLSTLRRFGVPVSQFRGILRPVRSVAALWLSVLTVILCAVLPTGLPQTAAHGSAFNPATTAVALVAKGPGRSHDTSRANRRDPLDPQTASQLMMIPGAALPFRPAPENRLSTPRPTADISPLPPQACARLPRARAPPAI